MTVTHPGRPGVLALMALVLAMPPRSLAAPDSPSNLTDLLRAESSVLRPLERITGEVLAAEQALADARRDLAAVEYRLAETERRIKALQTRSAGQQSRLRARLKLLYKMSRGGFARAVLDRADSEDLFSRLSAASRVVQRDVDEIALYRRELARHRRQRAALRTAQKAREAALATVVATYRKLRRARDVQFRRLWQVRTDRKIQMKLAGELTDRQHRLLKRVAGLNVKVGRAEGFSARKGSLARPVAGAIVGRFGRPLPDAHQVEVMRQGVTFRSRPRAWVRAVAPGVVRVAGPFSGFGTIVLLQHADNFFTVHGFLGSTRVKQGQRVAEGARIGRAGRDPLTGQPGAYFELRHNDTPKDPVLWFR